MRSISAARFDAHAGAAHVAYAVAGDDGSWSVVAFNADRGEYLHAYGITEAEARAALLALAQNFTVGET